MMGSMLAATKETPGEVVGLDNGVMVKLYRGMGSPSALKDSSASRKRYGISGSMGKPLAEGVESYVPYKGSVVDVMDHYTKALRKSMSYCGAANIDSHRKETGLWRITNAGLRESHPHDVKVINN
jgi:IMP dehydrogenase